jgi:hypothetical protein
MLCGELQIADAIAMDGWQSLLAEAVTWTGRSSGSIWPTQPTQQTAAAARAAA